MTNGYEIIGRVIAGAAFFALGGILIFSIVHYVHFAETVYAGEIAAAHSIDAKVARITTPEGCELFAMSQYIAADLGTRVAVPPPSKLWLQYNIGHQERSIGSPAINRELERRWKLLNLDLARYTACIGSLYRRGLVGREKLMAAFGLAEQAPAPNKIHIDHMRYREIWPRDL